MKCLAVKYTAKRLPDQLAGCPLTPWNRRKGAVGYGDSQQNPMRYEILVPSAPYESESVCDLDRAHDICYDLAEEHGYAEIRHNGHHIADYGNPATFLG